MITTEQSLALKDYFPVKAHEFLQGATYLTEEAITNRLDDIDPSWQFKKLEIRRDGTTVTAVYCMIVCGVERDGVGMAAVQYGKDKDGKPSDREVNEAEKSAATDALKRCARLFGIGRYILEMGRAVNDERSLEQWLIQRSNVTPLNSRQEGATADLAQAAGDYEQRTPKQALNGNGAPSNGAKKRMGNEPPVEGDCRDFQVTSVSVKFKDGQPRYALNATDNAVIWAYSRDVFRAMGYPENVIEDWGAKEQTIKFEQKMPVSAEWKLYQTGKEPRSGYWAAKFEAVEPLPVSEEPF